MRLFTELLIDKLIQDRNKLNTPNEKLNSKDKYTTGINLI